MTDIVERIRSLRYVHVPVASQLFEEAAAEIERLRKRVTEPLPKEKRAEVALTDEEREAIEWFSRLSYGDGGTLPTYCATLRAMLKRLA
jgi:hypothetical protein